MTKKCANFISIPFINLQSRLTSKGLLEITSTNRDMYNYAISLKLIGYTEYIET